jgi:hypothetical protein
MGADPGVGPAADPGPGSAAPAVEPWDRIAAEAAFAASVGAARATGAHGAPDDGEWVWPAWMEAAADGRAVAGRWTTLGVVGRPEVATVDPRGLVAAGGHGWSVDWWVGTGERWHLPSRDVAVRQRRLEGASVVETAMRIGGGDARQRCWTVVGPPDLLVVEVSNDSPAPFALAVAVRPYDAAGPGRVTAVRLDGPTLLVDGRPAVVLDRVPSGWATSTAARGDAAVGVLRGEAGTDTPLAVDDPEGLATAVVVVPVPHRQSVRIVLPLATTTAAALAPLRPADLPGPEAVARGWRRHLQRGARVELPDPRLVEAIEACRMRQLVGPAPDPSAGTAEAVHVATLHGWGLHAEAVGLGSPSPAPPEGGLVTSLRLPGADAPGAGAALWSAAEAWRLGGDPAAAAALSARVGALLASRTWAPDRLPPGPVGAALWWLRGLVAAVAPVAAAGGPVDVLVEAAAALRPAVAAVLARGGEPAVVPAWPGGGPGLASIDGLLALVVGPPLGLPLDEAALVAATVAALDEPVAADDVAADPAAALALARVVAVADPAAAWGRLSAVLDQASPTWTWPDHLDPVTGGPDGVVGDDPAVAAGVLAVVRDLVAREADDGSIVLMAHVPAGWEGQGIEAHGMAVGGGALSFAVRWHGERPAVLWEAPTDDAVLRAPGLDPTWRGRGRTGDALLAPFAHP